MVIRTLWRVGTTAVHLLTLPGSEGSGECNKVRTIQFFPEASRCQPLSSVLSPLTSFSLKPLLCALYQRMQVGEWPAGGEQDSEICFQGARRVLILPFIRQSIRITLCTLLSNFCVWETVQACWMLLIESSLGVLTSHTLKSQKWRGQCHPSRGTTELGH